MARRNVTRPALSEREAEREAAWVAEMDAEPEHLGLCYFIGNDTAIKIGFSNDPWRRLDEIRREWCAEGLTVLATVRGHRFREAYYHKRFAAYALGNEWFERTPELLAEIERLAIPGGCAPKAFGETP